MLDQDSKLIFEAFMTGRNWNEAIQAAGYEIISSRGDRFWHVRNTKTGDEGILARQDDHIWHFFWNDFEGSASGDSPQTAARGGLGDVIGDDREMEDYKALMLSAPNSYLSISDGLYRNSSIVFNEPEEEEPEEIEDSELSDRQGDRYA